MFYLPFQIKYFKLNKLNTRKTIVGACILTIAIYTYLPFYFSILIAGIIHIFFTIIKTFAPVSEQIAIYVASVYVLIISAIGTALFTMFTKYNKRTIDAKKTVIKFFKNNDMKNMIYNNPHRSFITNADLDNLPLNDLGLIMGFRVNILLRGLENENRNQKLLQGVYEDIIYN